jgi:tRNA-dihydrouridine synthase 2
MFARGAQANVSVFRKEGMLPVHDVMREYIKIAMEYDMGYANCKYTLMQMAYPDAQRIEFQTKIIACRNYEQLSTLFELQDIYEALKQTRTFAMQ